MNTKQRLALVFVASLLAFAGCADTVKAPPGALGDPLHPQAYPQIVPLGGLAPWLYFDEPIVTASSLDAPMRVTVPLRLVYDEPREIQYSFRFFDADRRPLGSGAQWRWMRLEPRTQTFFEGNALQTAAVDWRLEVRPAR